MNEYKNTTLHWILDNYLDSTNNSYRCVQANGKGVHYVTI